MSPVGVPRGIIRPAGVLLGAVAAVTSAAMAAAPASAAAQEPIFPAPGSPVASHGTADLDWMLRGLDGRTFSLAEYAGRPLVLNLWATWCAPCVAELASLERLRASMAGTGVEFLIVSPESPERVRAFLQRHGYGLPAAVEDQRMPASWGLEALPTTWVVDGAGRIVLRHRGAANWDQAPIRRFLCALAAPGACGAGTPRESPSGPMTDDQGWWRRVGDKEKGFTYEKVDGEELVWEAGLDRIDRLAIPPAWTDVHIAPTSKRPIQAWGRDAAGRKQYIYSEEAVEERQRRKWDRVLLYARVVPELRAATNADLKRAELDRRKVLATVVRLISRAFFRIGSERYAVQNKTFGIATLKKRHLEIQGNDLVFSYSGKRRKDHRRVVADTPLVEVIRELVELPGSRLFRYRAEDGTVQNVTAPAVNRYIKGILHERYTSKDLRTFGGTVRAATILADLGPASSQRAARSNTVMTARLVASELGNTPAIARSAYIHPAVFEEYEAEGRTIEPLMRKRPREVKSEEPVEYYPEEAALMRFLERYG